ncbi:caspase-8-like [Anneissia japonica]|uniref:caspase-8-like n=1 Tax=Anneissia japonica TaxID=1529436 RepID=UPI001425A669|nr:caspase-8-like [Anneissia japonica]
MAALRDRVPTRDLTDDEFQKLLYNIDKNLEEQELLILKYLCRDKSIKLKYGPLENCKNCLQLFDLLQRRVYLNKGNLNLLIELLSYINCTELIDRIEEKCGTIEKKKIVSLYRRMVLDCLYLISDSEFDQFKSYTRRVLGGSMEKLKFQIQMMNALEKKGCIGPEKVDYLLEMSEQLERSDMSQEVKRYQREILIGRYKMDSKPRGFCVIINNMDFSNSETVSLMHRMGSDKDKEKLEETFINNLGFTAWEKSPTDNLTAEEMRRVMDEVSKEDHSEFDCFVCCILSHGNCGKVTGVDGNPCEIMDIARIMSTSNCPSLAS